MRIPKHLSVISAPAVPQFQPQQATIPQEFSHPGLSLQQIFTILWAYRKQTIIIAMTIIVLSAVILKLLPKTYAATATLIVNYEVNDPLSGETFPLGLLDSYLATRIEYLSSRNVLLPVVDKLKLTEYEPYAAGFQGDANGLRNWVQQNLSRDLEIGRAAPGSQLINVTAYAPDSTRAAQIANTIVDVYLPLHRQQVAGPATERAERYAEQLAELKEKVAAAQDQLTEFRRRTGIADVNADTESAMLTTLEQRYLEAQNARRLAEVKQAEDKNTSAQILASNSIQQMKGQLSMHEAQMAQLRTSLGPRHPQILQLESQIEATKLALAKEIETYSSGASTELTATRQLEAKLQAAVAEQRAKVLGVRNEQGEGAKYALELDSAQAVYKRALEGYDQILAAAGGEYTNINVFNRATPPLEAAKPNKMKLLVMSIMAGGFLGLAIPFCFELFKRRIRCSDDLEREFSLPVLVELEALTAQGAA